MGLRNCPKNLPIKQRFERFFVKGPDGECWPWLGSPSTYGYGVFRTPEKSADKAHRVSYLMHRGEIPDGLQVMHSCDNRICVNPAHLSLGTNAQNQEQAWARDRKQRVRKLSPEDIKAIKKSKETNTKMAVIFGVNQSEISRIRSGKRGNSIMKMQESEGVLCPSPRP